MGPVGPPPAAPAAPAIAGGDPVPVVVPEEEELGNEPPPLAPLLGTLESIGDPEQAPRSAIRRAENRTMTSSLRRRGFAGLSVGTYYLRLMFAADGSELAFGHQVRSRSRSCLLGR